MTTLVVDHLDSFTFNLVQQIGALGGDPVVVRSDRLTMDAVHRIAPSRIVLSPGPGDPNDPARAGIAMELLAALPDMPILGVCFGHQLIVRAFGGTIVRTTPRHGKTSPIEHTAAGIFRDLPRPFEAMRYHSLAAGSVPADLEITAWCKDGTVMAVSHRSRPVIGVQFHPESIGTPAGSALVGAFLAIPRTDVLLSESA